MTRTITPFVLEKLKQWEGLRLEAYQDSGGVWTIGYGHTGPDVRKGLRITEAQAGELLRADLARFEHAVNEAVAVPLTDNQFGTLVSFAFNVGEAAFRRSTLLKRVNARQYNDVPAQLARWVHAGGKRMQGLVNRRAAEAGLWAAGAFVASAPVVAAPAVPPLLTKEVIAMMTGMFSSMAAMAGPSGPLQWVVACVVAVSFGAAGVWWLRNRMLAAN